MRIRQVIAIAGGVLIAGVLLLGIVGLGIHVVWTWPAGRAVHGGDGVWKLPPPFLETDQHGVVGRVESVNLEAKSMTVVNERGKRRLVLLRADTVLERPQGRVTLSTITAGEHVVAIGTPDEQGHLVARAIRVLPRNEPAPSLPGADILYRILRLLPPWFHRLLWRIV